MPRITCGQPCTDLATSAHDRDRRGSLAASSAVVLGHQLGSRDPQWVAVVTTSVIATGALAAVTIAWRRGIAFCRGTTRSARISGLWFAAFTVLAVAWVAVVLSAGWIGFSHGD